MPELWQQLFRSPSSRPTIQRLILAEMDDAESVVNVGLITLMNRIQMRNIDLTVKALINRAIFQRTGLGNGDPHPTQEDTG